MDAAPAIEITITKTEKHNVREEAIERVARQLCLADGCNPDDDIRCGPIRLNEQTVLCNSVGMTYPSNLRWNAYREKAIQAIKQAFP